MTGANLDQLSQNVGLTFASGTPGDIINEVVKYVLVLAGLVLLVYLIYGGYEVMLSGGDKAKVEQGKQKITNALVGFLVIFLAYWIVQIVGIALGLTDFQDVFGR